MVILRTVGTLITTLPSDKQEEFGRAVMFVSRRDGLPAQQARL